MRPVKQTPEGAATCPTCGEWDSVAGIELQRHAGALYQECLECGTLWHNHAPDSRAGRLATRHIEDRRGGFDTRGSVVPRR